MTTSQPDAPRGAGHRAARRAAAVALLLCACGFPRERGQQLEQRLDRLEQEGPAHPRGGDRAAAQERARQVDAQLAELQRKVDALEAGSRPPHGGAPTAQLATELAEVRAALDRQAHRLEAIEKTLAQARAGGGERHAQRRRAPAPAVPDGAAAQERPSAPPPAGRADGGRDVLALARDQEDRGEKAVARDLYQEYVQKFPDDPGAAEAHFRLGELAFGERRYQDAMAELGKVARDFPASPRAPAALLRTADAMLALHLADDAVAVLSEIPERYPGTPAAARARQRLAELARPSAPAGAKHE